MKTIINTFRLSLVLLLLMLTSRAYATFDEVTTLITTGSQLSLNSTHIVQENLWTNMTTANSWLYDNKNSTARLEFRSNPNKFQPNAYTAQVQLKVTKRWMDNAGGVIQSQVEQPQFFIDYNPAGGSVFNGRSVYIFDNAYEVEIEVEQITFTDQTTGTTSNVLPDFLELEVNIQAERFYHFDRTLTAPINSLTESNPGQDGKINISWNTQAGAEEYDFEWTWIDNYKGYNESSNTIDFEYDLNQLLYDFQENSQRITTFADNYSIDKVYDRGYLVFRVRGVGRHIDHPDQRIEGSWSISNSSGTIASLGNPNDYFHIDGSKAHESNLNWNYQIVYAEDGRSKQSISYADGSLRTRQSLSLLNSKGNRVIAQENLFDVYGRPAISVMPAPLNPGQDELRYYPNLNRDAQGGIYNWEDFDNGDCATIGAAPMSTAAGANQYYSPNNPQQDDQHAYLPNANGYAFSQVEYMPDNTGRIKRQGGVGQTFQLGSGHETQFFYADVKQEELNRLFGSNVGDAKRYKKNAVVDGNGQLSVSYLLGDRVVATALAGETPTQVEDLNPPANPINTTYNFITAGDNKKNNLGWEVNYQHLVTSAAPHTLSYSFNPQDFNGFCQTSSLCFDCVYLLQISVKNECGEEMLPNQNGGTETYNELIGPFDDINDACDASNTFNSFSRTMDLAVGTYTISKKLLIHRPSLDSYRGIAMDENLNACIPDYQTILDSLMNEIDPDACGLSACEIQAYEALGEDDGTNPNWQSEFGKLVEDCEDESLSYCENLRNMMLLDLSPGGQYATYEITASGSYSAPDPYSLFNTATNNNGLRDYRGTNDPGPYTYQNVTLPPTAAVPNPNQVSWGTLIDNWDPSWSEAMLELHPEYCKLQWCEDTKESNDYDLDLAQANTLFQAGELGFIQAGTYAILDNDPFFTNGPGNYADMYNALQAFFPLPSGNTVFSAERVAYLLSVCDFDENTTEADWIACNTANPALVCDSDEAWIYYRNFYIGLKTRLKEAVKENNPNYPCFGINFPGKNSLAAGLDLLLPGIQIDQNPEDLIAQHQSTANGQVADQCASTCANYRPYWEEQLKSCLELNFASQSEIDELLNEFERICQDGCDPNHPLGSSSINPAIVDRLSTYNSFADAIDAILGGNYSDPKLPDFKPLCNVFLLSNPSPYEGQSLSGAAGGTFPTLDGCACDAVKSIEADFAAMAIADRPEGVNSAADLFAHTYGQNLARFDDISCECTNIWNTNFQGQTWQPNSDWSAATAAFEETTDLVIPGEIGCTTCLTCTQVINYFEDQDLIDVFAGTPEALEVFGRYLNAQFKVNLSYQEYEEFYYKCKEAGETGSTCDENSQLAELIPFLNELISNGKLTSRNTSIGSYTSFVGSTLYGNDPTSCLPQADARILFSRLLNVEIYDMIPTQSGGTLLVGKNTGGELVIALQNSDDTYAWATQPSLDWQSSFLSFDFESLQIIENQNNEFILASIVENSANTERELNLIKVAPGGSLLWQNTYSHQGRTSGILGLFEQSDGDIVLGLSQAPDANGFHNSTLLIAVDNGGNIIPSFTKEYEKLGDLISHPSQTEGFKQLVPADADGFYLGAMLEADDALAVLKFDQAGGIIWKNAYPTYSAYCQEGGQRFALAATADEGVAVLVNRYEEGVEYLNRIFKITKNGSNKTQVEYRSVTHATLEVHDFEASSDNGLLIAGINPHSGNKAILLKLDPVGNLLWGHTRSATAQSHIRVIEKEAGHYLLLQKREQLDNLLMHNGSLRSQCPGDDVSYIHYSLANPNSSFDIGTINSLSLNSTTSQFTSSTSQITESPACGETLILSLTDNCALDCEIELSLPNGGLFRELLSFSNPQLSTSPEFSVSATYNTTAGQQSTSILGTYSCLGDCAGNLNNGTSALTLCNRPFFLRVELEDPCQPLLEREAENLAFSIFTRRVLNFTDGFDQQYESACLDSVALDESFTLSYTHKEHHYTLYYYDQVGNLVQTVPPEGVSTDGSGDHEFRTQYAYNSLNQQIWKHTPDGGEAKAYFDDLGRVILSIDARQLAASTKRASYVRYDNQGRIIEAGELEYNILPGTTNGFLAYADYENWLVGKTFLDRRYTFYDELDPQSFPNVAALFENGEAEQLRSRVSASVYFDGSDPSRHQAYYFSYDVHGNVKEIVVDNPSLEHLGERFKLIRYKYDLFSGNVKEVFYQPGKPDQFIHRYTYDDDLRIKEVQTSKDGHSWEQDAKYEYYLHGPMSRTELGESQVAGIDYVYTLQGWISGINSTSLDEYADPGKDGNFGPLPNNPLNAFFARDAFSFSLGYYEGDYSAISGLANGFRADPTALYGTANAKSLYNGNIAWMSTSLFDDQGIVSPQAAVFSYDQLQRLKKQNVFTSPNVLSNLNSWAGATTNGDYQVELSYDANGNIKTLNRNGLSANAGGQAMDRLEYEYYQRPNPSGSGPAIRSNRLAYVKDDASLENAYSVDVDDQSVGYTPDPLEVAGNGNYEYDAIGNMVVDKQEEIANIEWTVSGKIRYIQREVGSSKPDLAFTYDVNDNRSSKTVIDDPTKEDGWKTTFYLCDMDGNPMSIYKRSYKDAQTFTTDHPEYANNFNSQWAELWYQEELPIYGSSRLGMLQDKKLVKVIGFDLDLSSPNPGYDAQGRFLKINETLLNASPPPGNPLAKAWSIGKKRYGLSEHRGNESVVITDHKLQIGNSSLDYFVADRVSSRDYYPFGMEMMERGDPGEYRFGFNGMEKDDRIKGVGNSYTTFYRQYDPRIGRWMSLDPEMNKFADQSPYNFVFNQPITSTDPLGNCPNGDCPEVTITAHAPVNQASGYKELANHVANN
ncbi:MAG: RHS repeat-associated core domain-containing protein, partial [Bacteroidota bacterium]